MGEHVEFSVKRRWLPHGKTWDTCRRCKGQKKRSRDPATGLPFGRGGEPCPDCKRDHPHGEMCSEEGIRKAGWVSNGVDVRGTPMWVSRRAVERKARKARRKLEVNGPLVEVLNATQNGAILPMAQAVLERIPPAPPDEFTQRLDSQTQKTWMLVAKARLGGLSDGQVAEALQTDEQFVSRLVTSSVFVSFEADFRLALASGPELEAVQRRLSGLMVKALDAWEYWVDKREPELWAASLQASKHIAAAFGVDTERRKVVKVKATVTPKQMERFIESIGRPGA